ncbi:MAG: LD-carboxypeptidase [Ignavibacteria bacterium]|nr:LD-carboxypeptidase [Ignavibacteria bacterium]
MDRRTFIGVVGFGALLYTAKVKGSENLSFNSFELIYPPLLKKGSKVAFTAPGSPVNIWELRYIANFFQKNGCSIVYGETVTKRDKKFRYLSRDDKFRAEELNRFFADPSIHCIVAARGGYGSIRILDLLDYDTIQKNPKVFIGFSDITVLLNAIYKKTNLVTFHGPTGNFFLDRFTISSLETMIFDKSNNGENIFKYKFTKSEILNPGETSGHLVGGNLSNLVSLLGTEFEFDTKNSLLFLEEISEHPYRIDRMLKQMELAGKFKDCKGVLLGYFGKLDTRRNFYPDYSFTLREIFDSYFKKFDFPVVLNLPFGHQSKFITFPIGGFCEISSKNLEICLNLYEVLTRNENMLIK